MYSDYVHKALDDRAHGRDASYHELVSQFKLPAAKDLSSTAAAALPPISLLQMLLHALSSTASKLDRRNHAPLVQAILTLPWATMGGDTFARTWMRFVCNLCSVRSEWVGEVLSRAVQGLSYRSDWRSMAYAPTTSSARPTRRLIYGRIHTLLRTLFSLIPTLPTQLSPLVLRYFPHKGEGIREHVVYIQNIFEMCSYATELQHNVLEYVIGRGLEIDVEIQVELDELEEAEADLNDVGSGEGDQSDMPGRVAPLDIGMLDRPLDEDSGSSASESESDDDEAAGFDGINSDDDDIEGGGDDVLSTAKGSKLNDRQRVIQVRGLVDKLDAVMAVLFAHIESLDHKYDSASRGLQSFELTPARAISLRNELFSALLHVFTRTILPTFKSRHVQFLLFWSSSLDRDFSDMFLGLLLGKAIYSGAPADEDNLDGTDIGSAMDEESGRSTDDVPIVMRIAASSYVASLVSRATYISAQDVRSVMLNLVSFLEAHLDAYSAGAFGIGSSQGHSDATAKVSGPHALFYAICQACLYIFCFRWRDLQLSPARHRQPSMGVSDLETDDDEDDNDDDEERNGAIPSARWCEGMDTIKRAIMSRLNPLAHCSSTVVQQFAGVAQLTGFLYCWSIIESNSRSAKRSSVAAVMSAASGSGTPNSPAGGTPTCETPSAAVSSAQGLSRTSSSASLRRNVAGHGNSNAIAAPTPAVASLLAAQQQQQQQQDIDSFFPFDPYRLRSSTRWIEPLYREWGDVAPEGMIEDDADDDDDDGDTDDSGADAVNSAEAAGDSNDSDDSDEETEASSSRSERGPLSSGLAIPRAAHHTGKNARRSTTSSSSSFLSPPSRFRGRHRFGASASTNDTDESSSVEQSLEAMSISPRHYARS